MERLTHYDTDTNTLPYFHFGSSFSSFFYQFPQCFPSFFPSLFHSIQNHRSVYRVRFNATLSSIIVFIDWKTHATVNYHAVVVMHKQQYHTYGLQPILKIAFFFLFCFERDRMTYYTKVMCSVQLYALLFVLMKE